MILLLALAIRFKRARFELAHVLRSERADIVDVHQFVRHLPNVVQQHHRLECHRSVHGRSALSGHTMIIEPICNEKRAGVECARAADLVKSLKRGDDSGRRRLNDDGLE